MISMRRRTLMVDTAPLASLGKTEHLLEQNVDGSAGKVVVV